MSLETLLVILASGVVIWFFFGDYIKKASKDSNSGDGGGFEGGSWLDGGDGDGGGGD